MLDYNAAEGPLTVLPADPPKKGQTLLAWIAILGMLFVLVFGDMIWGKIRPESPEGARKDRMDLFILRFQARYMIGASNLVGGMGPGLYAQLAASNGGPLDRRLCFVVLAWELAGPEKAAEELRGVKKLVNQRGDKLSADDVRLERTIDLLYGDYENKKYSGPSVTQADRQFLVSELGWFGKLALAPSEGPDKQARTDVIQGAYKTFAAIILVVGTMGVLGVLGFVGGILFMVGIYMEKIRSALRPGIAHGGVYAETFAVYLFVFFGLSIAAGMFRPKGSELLIGGAISLFSLIAILWPVFRGIPFHQVCQDIGWTSGKGFILEPIIGVGGYAMTLPLLAVGVVFVLILMFLQELLPASGPPGDELSPPSFPGHPIVPLLAGAGWWGVFQALLLASVIAPIVEETMFRGVFYRHLREGSQWLGTAGSGLFSGLVASFIFAAIHPQGFVAVPALMALALGFTILREWRGTLIPCMVAHGLSNGLVMCLAVFGMGD